MRKIFFSSLLFALLVLPARPALCSEAAPEYAGVYSGTTTWEGTVTMIGDVLIPVGGKLTIQSGTEVRVVPAEGTQIDPEYLSSQTELLIRGQLEINGTKESPVRFTIVQRPGLEEVAWSGITLDAAGSSRISHAVMERADIGIRCVASSPLLEGNSLTACRYGIVAQQQSHPRIINNTITDGEGGIFCWRNSNPYLKGNQVIGHDEEGVFVDASSRPRLDHNDISRNAIGLTIYPVDLPYDPASLHDNLEDVRQLGRQGQSGARP